MADFSPGAVNAALDGIEAHIGTAAVLKLFTGAKPANTSAVDTGTELVEMALPSDWLADAAGGVKAKAGTWSGTGGAAGDAGHFRAYANGGTVCHMQGTVSNTAGSGELKLDTITIAIGQTVTITAFNLNGPGYVAVITPPVLTPTSAAGDPLAFSIEVDETVAVGMYWNLQLASDAAFTTGLAGEGSIREELLHQITLAERTTGIVEFAILLGQPAGPIYARLWVSRDPDPATDKSDYSNTINTTVVLLDPVKWNSAAKSSFITLSGSDLIATGTSGVGASQPVLGTTGKGSGKWYFEVEVDPSAAFHGCAVGLASALPANFTTMGSTSTAIGYAQNGNVTHGGSTVGAQTDWSADAVKVIGVAIDADADKVWFAIDGTFSGSPAAGTGGYDVSSIGTYFPLFATTHDDVGVLRGTGFTYTPPSGFTGWNG